MLFDERIHYKPFEYPEVLEFTDGMSQTYWVHSEVNFDSDLQEYKTELTDIERSAIVNSLKAISQVEVAVKSYWGNLYKYLPKPEFNGLGSSFAECHAEGTEILTPKGWVDFRDINIGDKVFQYHHNGFIEITQVQAKTEKFYSGDIYHFYKQSAECVVTPDHKMIYFDYKGRYSESKASELSTCSSCNKLPEAATKLYGDVHQLSYMDRLRIALQADGSRKYWINKNGAKRNRGAAHGGAEYGIYIKKIRKINRLDNLLANLDLSFTKKPRKDGYIYIIKIDDDFNYKEFDWVDLNNKSSSWCIDFIEELAEWDGFKINNKKSKIGFSSTNKNAIDKAQLVGICGGYKTNINKRIDTRKASYKPCYKLAFAINKTSTHFTGLNKQKNQYTGMVYCVTVPSGAIITRYNNKTFIAGNSEFRHSESYSRLLSVIGIEDFEDFCKEPIIKERIGYLKSVDQSNIKDPLSFCRSMAIFSLAIENAALFSQFATILSFQRFKAILKNVSDIISWTSKDEIKHCMAGLWLINIACKEYNIDKKLLRESIREDIELCARAEDSIIDFIFEKGELDFLSKEQLKDFFRFRINEACEQIGIESFFDIKENPLEWFDEIVFGPNQKDFFIGRPVDYSKHDLAFCDGDLF